MEAVRRNSAFCLGVLIDSTGKALGPNFLQILQWLYPLCVRKANQLAFDTGGADIDNALSAVSKMIRIAPELVPLEQVLPVMVAALPLRADPSEGPSVYGILVTLLMNNNPVAFNNLPAIIHVFAHVVSPDSKDLDVVKAEVTSCIKSLASSASYSSLLANTMPTLDPTVQNIISATISS
jgi:hypothetical protein